MVEKRSFAIINREGLRVVGNIEISQNSRHGRLVFIEHGFKGSKDQPHIRAVAKAFLENGYTAVTFDTTHAQGESDGEVFDATYHTYIHDLDDVIEWAKTQTWYSEPFALCGHSMGAQAVAWYAEQHPQLVSLLLPLAPTVNYELHSQALGSRDDELMKTGHAVAISRSTGKSIRISSSTKKSLRTYNILLSANRLTMPVLNVVGSEDEPCPSRNQRIFYEALTGNSDKTLEVIPGAEHSYRNAKTGEVGREIIALKSIVSGWLSERTTTL